MSRNSFYAEVKLLYIYISACCPTPIFILRYSGFQVTEYLEKEDFVKHRFKMSL